MARCHNKDCPAKHRESLIYFAKNLKIDGLGEKTIDALLELELVHSPADFWKLTQWDLVQLPGFKFKKVENLLMALEERKNLSLSEIFTGLGIRLIGSENSKMLANFFRHRLGEVALIEFLGKAREVELEELQNVDGVGEKVAEYFYNWLHSESTEKIWVSFAESGISLDWPEEKSGGKLNGTKFVITGSFENFSRDELKKIVTDNGGKILSAISRNCDVLLAGEKAGSKLKKAEELEIKIWDEQKICDELDIKVSAPQDDNLSLF